MMLYRSITVLHLKMTILLNTSDEMDMTNMIDIFLGNQRLRNSPKDDHVEFVDDHQGEPQPSTSRGGDERNRDQDDDTYQLTPRDRSKSLVRDAEQLRAKIFHAPGKNMQFAQVSVNKQFVHSMMVDENYMVVGGHLDEITYTKIVKGEYVDFPKLIVKDRLAQAEDDET